MVLGPWKRGQEEELQKVDRKFALQDFDIADNAFRRVGRKAQDIAAVGDNASFLPSTSAAFAGIR